MFVESTLIKVECSRAPNPKRELRTDYVNTQDAKKQVQHEPTKQIPTVKLAQLEDSHQLSSLFLILSKRKLIVDI